MKPIDLTKALSPYKKGWVAIDKKCQVVVHASSFKEVANKTRGMKKVLLMPAAKSYFGFITRANV